MPFYDVRCSDCGKEANVKATMADKMERRVACPSCGSHSLETVYKNAPSYVKGTPDFSCPHQHICGGGCSHAQH